MRLRKEESGSGDSYGDGWVAVSMPLRWPAQFWLTLPLLFPGLLGIDGPAAFLKPEAQDPESKPRVLSVGSPPPEEGTEGSADGDSPVETASKPDLQEILQKHGEDGAELGTGYPPLSHRLAF